MPQGDSPALKRTRGARAASNAPADLPALRSFLALAPQHRPVVPRGPGLGLGGRAGALASTSAMLAIQELGIEAAAIQCSVFRELRPEFVEAQNTLVPYKGVGMIPVGHTGMTIRGQFLSAMKDRIRRGLTAPFVADADHIPLNGGTDEQIEEFRRFVDESRDRSFFTVDPHFCLDTSAVRPEDRFAVVVPAFERAAVVIEEIKGEDPYVIELSLDEAPGITTLADMKYLVRCLVRGRIPLFSIAPAIGFDKKDDDTRALRETLEHVLPDLSRVATDCGLVLGIHSGDGKSQETLRRIGELTRGRVWYKVSPDRQRLLFRILAESPLESPERNLFEMFHAQLLDMVRAGVRSPDAEYAATCRGCLQELKAGARPNADTLLFHHLGFLLARSMGPRLEELGEDFARRYRLADLAYVHNLTESLGLPRSKG